jgi:dipeptidyl aminopeptidase/acylaminoacyl peptidase
MTLAEFPVYIGSRAAYRGDTANLGVAVTRMPARVVTAAFATLLLLTALPASATVSGQNGTIIYVSAADGDNDIYAVNPDGTGIVQLTNAPDHDGSPVRDEKPTWSPDGRSIAFTRTISILEGSETTDQRSIWTMAADGSEQQIVVLGDDPVWSPDGRSIAFVKDSTGIVNGIRTTVIAVLDLQDGSTTVLTDPGDWVHWTGTRTTTDYLPRWLPGGNEILFARHFPGSASISNTSLLIVDTTTAIARSGPGISANEVTGLDVDPTGGYAVISAVPLTRAPPIMSILVLDDSPPVSINDPDSYLPSGSVSFAPSGDRIVSGMWNTTNQAEGVSVWSMGLDGSDPTKVVQGRDPVWQPVNPYPLGLVDPATGEWHLRQIDGRVDSFYFGNPGDIPFMGDWDCDGVDTPGLYRQSDGYVYLRNLNTQGVADIRFFFGDPGDIPLSGDFNGDSCDTVSVYRPSNATFYLINELGSDDGGLGAAEHHYIFGNPGDKPFIGDFDGDGVDTPGLHRESTGLVYYRNWNSEGVADAIFLFGDPGDRIVANDWNGDGVDSPAVFRPATATAYFRFTNSQGIADAQFVFGAPTWFPVTGTFE